MINISTQRIESRSVSPAQDDAIAHFTVNTDVDDVYFLSRNGVLSSSTTTWQLNDVTEVKQDKTWFNCHFICETGSIACLSSAGSIVSIADSGIPSLEGSFDDGIAAASWCPDDTIIVILVKNHSLISLTNTWDVVNEVPIEPCDLSNSMIAWRGDGSHFVTYTLPSTNITSGVPVINIYNKDLQFLYTCRTVAEGPAAVVRNLLPAVAFSLNGSIIAAPQRTPKKLQMVFFDRIGLKHTEFDIQNTYNPSCDQYAVTTVIFNIDSTLLCVVLHSATSTPSTLLQLYYADNYVWYLKYQRNFAVELSIIEFDTELSMRLHIGYTSADAPCFHLETIDLVMYSSVAATTDCSIAVTNGNQCLLTPLGKAIVPPPMSKYQLSTTAALRFVVFFKCVHAEEAWGLACVDGMGTLYIYYGNSVGKPTLRATIPLPDMNQCFHFHIVETSMDATSISYVVLLASASELIVHNISVNSEISITTTKKEILGKVLHLSTWQTAPPAFAVGIEDGDSFDLFRFSVDNSDPLYLELQHEFSFPEICSTIEIIHCDTGVASYDLALGLSERHHRLYSGETLISTNVTSFYVNHSLLTLLYVTGGSRPELHFTYLSTIRTLDPLHAVENQPLLNFAESRPLERGARLVASPEGSAVVVVQMPRGNLEAFEPRPLILMKSALLLDQHRYTECLLLLRRQRVDLNLLHDYAPSAFMQHIPTFTQQTLQANPEYLSLFISALQEGDVILSKFPYFQQRTLLHVVPDKINTICTALQAVLLKLLSDGVTDALNPLLCCYTKQSPPLLVDALKLIKQLAITSAELSSSKITAAIKYTAFLVEGSKLFSAALGECDFAMARAVARQCQMDPKEYQPLLERLESYGKDEEVQSANYYYMFYMVHVHLENAEKIVTYGLSVLQAMIFAESKKQTVQLKGNLTDIVKNVIALTAKHNLHTHALAILHKMKRDMPVIKKRPTLVPPTELPPSDLFTEAFNKVYVSFGDKSVAKANYKEAITAYLSASPPAVVEAIHAAKCNDDWQLCITLASRHAAALKKIDDAITPKQLAQDLIEGYRTSLEQGLGADDTDECVLAFRTEKVSESKAVEAAMLSLEYFDDVEGAVGLLLLARHWWRAADVASQKQRNDLLREEVGAAVRYEAKRMINLLESRGQKHVFLVAALQELWKDPADRLEKVATTDPSLLASLRGQPLDTEDSVSEFGGGASVYSDMSYASATSDVSQVSTSTLSVLSNITYTSSLPATTKSKSFAIDGIEHNLLSRGQGDGMKSKESDKKTKRKERKKYKGEGRDVHGLKKESKMTKDLYELGAVADVVSTVEQVCDVLVFLGTADDHALACQLQHATDSYIALISSTIPPVAPLYPLDWLTKRAMEVVQWFQQQPEGTIVDDKMWWKMAANGIAMWQTTRRLSLMN